MPGRPWRTSAAAYGGRFAVVAVGAVAAFFVAFNAVFSDVFGAAGRVGVMFYVLAAYAVLGAISGVFGPSTGWRWAWWLCAPAAVILIAYSAREPGGILWHLIVFGLAWTGAAGGAASGAALRRSRHRDSEPPAAA